MSVSHTSIASYHGSDFSAKETEVLSALAVTGKPMTRRMIAAYLNDQASSVSGRVNALIDSGAIDELPETAPCPISQKRVKWLVLTNSAESGMQGHSGPTTKED